MTDESAPAEFTRADAVAAIAAMDAPKEPEKPVEQAPAEAAPEAEQPESEATPTAEDEDGQQDAAPVDDDAEQPEQETPAIEFPRSWAADDREVFATLPEEARKVILARENQRDSAVSKAQKEASDARKAANDEVSKLTGLKPQIEGILTQAQKTFAGQWDNIDWVKWAQQDPSAAMAGKFQMEQEQAEITKLAETQKALEQQEIQKFVADEFAKLPEVCPDLVDPKEGQGRRKSVAEFLLKQGVKQEQLPHISAVEMSLAYDAMRYRQLKQPPPVKAPTAAPVKSQPARPASSPSRTPDNELANAQRRFNLDPSRANAVALMKAKGL